MSGYQPSEFEKKWQDKWEYMGLFFAKEDNSKPKKYILSMFPYPSGALHMGHVMNYTINDVIARYSMMNGYNVMTPIGWDSFGLPAENAAIKNGIHPSQNIKINIERMKSQMAMAGWGFDKTRELSTSAEDYYKWTQWLFLQFYKKGLVAQKDGAVNYCPSCKTVLANEQVQEGKCERCGTDVIQKDLRQWYFLMSKYAQKLLDNHEKLTQWPERVIKMQKEWIGRSEGALVGFKIENSDKTIDVYTTRPDTLWGVKFMSMAPQHPLAQELIKGRQNENEIRAKIEEMKKLGTSEKELLSREKEGVWTGAYAINPVNGEKVKIFVANFAIMSYGTGVVMAVPTHDQRDFEFAQKYGIEKKVVIQSANKKLVENEMECAYEGDGILVDSAQFSGRNNREAMSDIISYLEEKGFGKKTLNYRLRDWLLSRQRYWGAPIPIIHCPKCGVVCVPESDLPVKLPDDVEFRPDGDSPLARSESFVKCKCPKCGAEAKRETDTMDTFVDSSWYYLRYCSTNCHDAPFRKDEANYWGPIDIYIGGIEHATMHLIYVRFFTMVMKELGLIDFDEPAKKLFTQGMVCAMSYRCPQHKWLKPDEVSDGKCVHCAKKIEAEVAKMSKTRLNVIDPEDIINRFGADTMRAYILADVPPINDRIWKEEGVIGISRFLTRFWESVSQAIQNLNSQKAGDGFADKEMRFAAHSALKSIIQYYDENWQFNTALARSMELLNSFRKLNEKCSKTVLTETIEIMLKVLAPITPHLSEELWGFLGNKESIFRSRFPKVDETAIIKDSITIGVQINGKMRATIDIPNGASQEETKKLALENGNVKKYLENLTIRKVIVVANKIVNIVAN
ncbi:MAG: leucine--tRNA ligase [Chitinispirillales bacterium]|jgi:leucyl-tRNA synthetase|nr:leucine--tRNA ligase [Chitinispirillales bacterium]